MIESGNFTIWFLLYISKIVTKALLKFSFPLNKCCYFSKANFSRAVTIIYCMQNRF
jgi:hypothetical protein